MSFWDKLTQTKKLVKPVGVEPMPPLGVANSTPEQIQPLFSVTDVIKEVPRSIFDVPKKVIAGGVPRMFSSQPAPATYGEAIKEGIKIRNENLSKQFAPPRMIEVDGKLTPDPEDLQRLVNTTLNFSPIGMAKAGSGIIRKIATSRNPTYIAKLLTKEIPNISPEVATQSSVLLKEMTDPQAVETVINRLNFKFNAPKGAVPEGGFWDKVQNAPDQSLLTEARKDKTAEEFIKGQKTGDIPSGTYDSNVKSLSESSLLSKENNPVVVGKIGRYEIRESGKINQYAKVNNSGEIVRSTDGNALYLSPEEIKAKGLAEKDPTLVVFDGNKPVGYVMDSFGSPEISVAKEYQRQGIGSELLKRWMQKFPNKKIGQMTPEGEAMVKSQLTTAFNEAKGATKAPSTAKPVSSLLKKLNIRTSNNPTTPYETATPTAYGEIATYKVFSHLSVDGKSTGVTDYKTGLSVGTSRFKNGKRAIEDVTEQLLAKAKSPEELKKAFEGGHAKNVVINTEGGIPTKSTSPLGRTPHPPETKVSLPEKGAPKQGTPVLQKTEKVEIVAPVRSEKPLQKVYTPKEEKAIQGIADNFKEPVTLTQKRLNTLRKIKDDIVEFVQNKETRVLKLVEQKGVKITDASDPYLKATLYPGKVDTLIKTGHTEGQAIVNEAKTLATNLKKDLADVRKEVNEFLVARHAPERNLALGDKAAGMSTAEATAKLEAIKNSPQGAEIAKIADKVQTLNNKILDILRDGGVISDELYTTLRTKYKNHIPLNRIFEETDDFAGALSGTGFNVRSTGIKKAVGSQREVSDILGNVLHNYEQAVLRAEKNIVDNATLAFVRANESNLFEVVKPKMIGRDFAGKPLMETTTDPSILQMFENGKKVWIKINDPKLAIALQGVGKEKLGTILNAVGSFTRLYAGLATRFNPEFALPNKIRDLQETMVYLASRPGVGGKGAFKAVTKDPQSMKDVVDFMRGKNTPGAKLYAEMKSLGGTTGGFGLSTKAKVEMDIKTMEALANSKTRKVVDNLVEYVDNWNTIFEDSTRLSVYKQALEQGLSKERAAFLSKEASINFNRMGKGGPVVNALYMFSNASIQGSAKMIRAMKNPKVAATVATVVGVAVAATNEWNDKADPEWRDKVPKWDRLNGLPIVIPSTDGTFRYVTIPVSWGIKPIKVSADFAYDMISGIDYSAKDVAGTLMTTILESYNPIGGTDLTSALAPTILDVPFDISRNKSWTGKMIKPDFDKNAPEDIKYFESLKKTGTGRTAISLTEMLQGNVGIAISPADIKYAFDSYIGGAGRSVTKTGNVLGGLAGDKPTPLDEYPFISRFYRESQPEETTGKSTEDISALLGQQSRENFKAKQEAVSYYEYLKTLPRDKANAELDALDISNPQLADRVENLLKEDQLGLTYADKQIKQLQVTNGARAQYIYDTAMKMKTTEERNAYLDDLTNKKIITDKVDEQLQELIINTPQPTEKTSLLQGVGDFLKPKTAEAAEVKSYWIRNNKIDATELGEARDILYAEVSNRPPDKQKLEAQVILNTAFNRMEEYRKRGKDLTLTEVLQMDNQYQGYAPKKIKNYKGELVESQYQKIKRGEYNKRRVASIDEVLEKVKDGTFQNNIGKAFYYVHKKDGRIIIDSKRKLFK